MAPGHRGRDGPAHDRVLFSGRQPEGLPLDDSPFRVAFASWSCARDHPAG